MTSFEFSDRVSRCKPSSSVQFENDNDVAPSVINMNRSRFPIFYIPAKVFQAYRRDLSVHDDNFFLSRSAARKILLPPLGSL